MTPSLHQSNLFSRVSAPPGMDAAPGDRYVLGEILGIGSSATVYTAIDTNFARTVAIKVIDDQIVDQPGRLAEFIGEVRISATLDHPNSVPVYDMDCTAEGGVYLSMKVVTGDSLAAAIELAESGTPPGSIATIADRLHIILHIANALACAHHQRIVHRDVKPANILLGRFGEVFLVDWGAALQLPATGPGPVSEHRIGTPFYMSPEQARCAGLDERSDIYGLGATMFHLVVGRVPLDVESLQQFWVRKCAGELDELTSREKSLIPRRLVAVLRKALQADTTSRYASIEDFIVDVRALLSGDVVRAYRETWWERSARWGRKNRLTVAMVAGCVVLSLVGGGWWLDGWYKDRVRWGEPVLEEAFDATWTDRWQANDSWGTSAFQVSKGGIEARGATSNLLFFKQRLSGRVAIDFIGEIAPGAPAGDLSVVWSLDDPFVPTKVNASRRWLLQLGADDNLYATLIRSKDQVRLAVAPFHLEVGRRYHIRAEIDGPRLALLVDGRTVLEHCDELPFVSGWIGLYGYYPGKRFNAVTLHAKGIPERIGALAIGDSAAEDGLWERAAEQYGHVRRTHAGTPLGEEACYRQGLALRQAGDRVGGDLVWAALADDTRRRQAVSWHARDLIEAGVPGSALALLTSIAGSGPVTFTRHRALTWVAGLLRALDQHDRGMVEKYVQWQARECPEESLTQEPAALAYIWLGQPEVVIERFSASPRPYAQALRALGRYNEVLSSCESLQERSKALLETGRYEQALREGPQVMEVHLTAHYHLGQGAVLVTEDRREGRVSDPFVLVSTGLLDEATARLEQLPAADRSELLMLLDRPADALAVGTPLEHVTALLAADRASDIITLPGVIPEAVTLAHADLLVQALSSNDQKIIRQELDWLSAEPERVIWGRAWWVHWLLLPWAKTLTGDAQAVPRMVERLGPETGDIRWHNAQRPWHALRFLAGLTDDRPVREQSATYVALSTALFVRAMRLDLQHDPSAAEAWAAWLELPVHQRVFEMLYSDPVAERLARWRSRLKPTDNKK